MSVQGQDTAQTGGRGTPNAWSPASNGQNWAQLAGTTTLGFTGTTLTLTGATGNAGRTIMALGATKEQASDATVHLSSTNDLATQGITLRIQSGTTYYRAQYSNSTLSIVKFVTGGSTTLASVAVSSAAGVGYNLHFQVNSLPAFNLQASFWLDSDGADPGLFLFATDSTSQLKPPGQFGLYGQCNTSADVLSYDSFLVQDVVPPPAPPVIGDLPYGMTLHVPTNKIPFLSQQTITDLQGWGQGAWLRYQLHWSSVDDGSGANSGQGNGVYNWQWSDYAVSLCNSFGFRILWPVQDPPLNYKTISPVDGSTQAPASTNYGNPPAWNTFMQAVCTRYNGSTVSPYTGYPMVLDAVSWENEDYDADNHQPRDIQSQWLNQVANASYAGIRATGYTGYIGFCAVRKTSTLALQHVTNWITNLFSYSSSYGTGLPTALLADPKVFLDFHYYRDGSFNLDPTTTNNNTPSVALELSTILSIARRFSSSIQVWCNEFGWFLYNATTDHFVSSSQTVSPALDAQYIYDMFDALRTGGGTHAMVFTDDPTAKVSVKNLPISPTNPTVVPTNVSSVPKSVTQLLGSVYTYFAPYTLVAQYAASYPTWPGGSTQSVAVAAAGRDGVIAAMGRDGVLSAAGRDGVLVGTGRDGMVTASGRDGVLVVSGRGGTL